jgi:hypothetical protein
MDALLALVLVGM